MVLILSQIYNFLGLNKNFTIADQADNQKNKNEGQFLDTIIADFQML